MKKYILSFILMLLITGIGTVAFAHPGRTDSKGGHNVNTTGHGYPVGSYHYHYGDDRDTAYDASGNVIQKSGTTPAPIPVPLQVANSEGDFYKEFPTIPRYNYPEGVSPNNTFTENGISVYEYVNSGITIYGLDLILSGFENVSSSENVSVFSDSAITVCLFEYGEILYIIIGETSKFDEFANVLESATSDITITVMVNEEIINFDQSPEIINERVMVPIRYVVEKIGCSVEWDTETQTVYINEPDIALNKTASKAENINVYVNNEKVMFDDQQPVNKNGRILIPVRFVVEKLGYNTEWDADSKTVLVTTDTPSSEPRPTSKPVEQVTSSTYKAIYDEYETKLKNSEKRDMESLATISNEGVQKMAEHMLKVNGSYSEYEDWAGKLMDVYMDEALKDF